MGSGSATTTPPSTPAFFRFDALLPPTRPTRCRRPPSSCDHPSPGRRQRGDACVYRVGGPSYGAEPDDRSAGGVVLLRRLHAGQQASGDASGDVLLQRRPWLGHGVAAPGIVRPEAPRHRRPVNGGNGSVSARRQRREPDRRFGPRLRRRGRHRLLRGDRAQTPIRPSGASMRTQPPSATSSSAIWPRTIARARRLSCSANRTARREARRSRFCWRPPASASMAWSCNPRS